jgi:hypothetical protein
MWYKVDFNSLALNFQLPALRLPKLMAFVYSAVKPMISLHYNWGRNREANLYRLAHTGQVCYLRKALNDSFDVDLRRIYIDGTGGAAGKTYIYTPGEEQPKYLGKIYLRDSLEFADTGADFLVYVPTSIAETMNYELRALIDFYKLASKRYLIIKI